MGPRRRPRRRQSCGGRPLQDRPPVARRRPQARQQGCCLEGRRWARRLLEAWGRVGGAWLAPAGPNGELWSPRGGTPRAPWCARRGNEASCSDSLRKQSQQGCRQDNGTRLGHVCGWGPASGCDGGRQDTRATMEHHRRWAPVEQGHRCQRLPQDKLRRSGARGAFSKKQCQTRHGNKNPKTKPAWLLHGRLIGWCAHGRQSTSSPGTAAEARGDWNAARWASLQANLSKPAVPSCTGQRCKPRRRFWTKLLARAPPGREKSRGAVRSSRTARCGLAEGQRGHKSARAGQPNRRIASMQRG